MDDKKDTHIKKHVLLTQKDIPNDWDHPARAHYKKEHYVHIKLCHHRVDYDQSEQLIVGKEDFIVQYSIIRPGFNKTDDVRFCCLTYKSKLINFRQ